MSNEDLYNIVNEIDYQNKTLNMEDQVVSTHETGAHIHQHNVGAQAKITPIKTRTPKNPISILRAVLKLPLQDRVDFRKEIDASIKAEVFARELQAKEAKDIANGLQ